MEWEPGKERYEGHKHDKGRRKLQETFRRRKVQSNERTHLPGNPPKSIDGRTHHIRRNYRRKSSLKDPCLWWKFVFREKHIAPRVNKSSSNYGKEGRSKTVLMDYLPYNIIIGRTEIKSLGAVGSTIHSMIKFPTDQGVVTMETYRETLRECKHLERVQGSWKEVQWRQREEQMSRLKEQVILRAKSNSRRGPSSGPVSLEKTQSKEDVEEVFTFSHERSDQYVTMGATLTTNCNQLLADILWENMEHKVKVVTDEPMEEILKLFGKEGGLAKWAAEVRTYDISYIPRKEAEWKKFFGQGEQVKRTPDANEGGTLTLSKKLQAKSTPTPRAWR
ncbi:hypothetical protein Tco_0316263 [Tanacetum coccineum]